MNEPLITPLDAGISVIELKALFEMTKAIALPIGAEGGVALHPSTPASGARRPWRKSVIEPRFRSW
jgi:hypothetical protein